MFLSSNCSNREADHYTIKIIVVLSQVRVIFKKDRCVQHLPISRDAIYYTIIVVIIDIAIMICCFVFSLVNEFEKNEMQCFINFIFPSHFFTHFIRES